MSLFTFLRGRRGAARRQMSCHPRQALRLQVETLEDRSVPASYTAATVPELIAAMDAANLTPEADTIALAAGTTFTLAAANNTAHGPTGLPVVAAGEDLTILGNGSTIERSTASGTPAFRLFDVAAGAGLTLGGVTLQGGLAYGVGVAASGGAIYSQGVLTLNGVTVQSNKALGARGWDATYTISRGGDVTGTPATDGAAALGGGLYIGGGTASLTGVTLSANTARGGDGGDGLNVFVHTRLDSGKLVIPPGNGGAGLGGGIYAAGGTVAVRTSSVSTNSALGGASGKGSGGAAGIGAGGGVYLAPLASVTIDSFTQFKRNKASTSDPNVYGPYTVGP